MKTGIARRELLATAGKTLALAASSSTLMGIGALRAEGKVKTSYLDLSLREAANALQKGEMTSEDYTATILEQCQRNAHLNAFITIDPQKTLEAARALDKKRSAGARLGRLHGVPIHFKDSINTKDAQTTNGTGRLKGFKPAEDAGLVTSIFSEGAILLAKANLHELSLGWTSQNAVTGAVRNPYDPTRMTGGSSGGTAAAVAARMGPAGIGEDTAGSIRIPSAFCGTTGLRPTTGRYSAKGVTPLAHTFDTAGPIARSVGDLALLDSVLSGTKELSEIKSLKGLRLAISPSFYFTDVSDDVLKVVNSALEKLKDAGVVIVEKDITQLQERMAGIVPSVLYYEAARDIPTYLSQYKTGVSLEELAKFAGPDTRETIEGVFLVDGKRRVTDEAYQSAIKRRAVLQEVLQAYVRENDVAAIVFPTTRVIAPVLTNTITSPGPDMDVNGKRLPARTAFSQNISVAPAAGIPGLAIPVGLTTDGLPVSIEMDAMAGQDQQLLAIGIAAQKVLGPMPAPKAI